MATEQNFLITVQRMCTSDECDLVSSWSAVVAEKDIGNFGALEDVIKLTGISLEGAPVTNIRPMTEAEIKAWRDADA
jgi:hypothetical protein